MKEKWKREITLKITCEIKNEKQSKDVN